MFEAALSLGVSLATVVLAGALLAGDRRVTFRDKVIAWVIALFPLFFTIFGWQVIAAIRGFQLAD